MTTALLVPVSLSAKVVRSPVAVPLLGRGRGVLEPGVHLHWALPDALTRGRLVTDDTPNAAVFPGVPDLWLVTRLNQTGPSNQRNAKRTWRAWVVDSMAETTTPLSAWTTPSDRDDGLIHTAAGVLPSAAPVGAPGWGLLNSNETFDPLGVAYYPACRKRLGLHDPLDDIPMSGKVSYTVVGWYSLLEYDPLWMAAKRRELLKAWKLAHSEGPKLHNEVAVQVAASSARLGRTWRPRTIEVTRTTDQGPEGFASARIPARARAHGDTANRLKQMRSSFPSGPAASANAAERVVTSGIAQLSGPSEIRCHGSVVRVDLGSVPEMPAPITSQNLRLYPSVYRAIAEIAAKNDDGNEQNVFDLELLLQGLGHQKGTIAGILDYPGAAHAATFQSMPGKSRFYARIEVHAKLPPITRNVFALSGLGSEETRVSSGHWPATSPRSALAAPGARSPTPGASLRRPSSHPPKGPTAEAIEAWAADVREAFASVKAAAAAAGTPIDPRLVHVHDHRPDAQPATLGPLAPGHGSDNAASWLDVEDRAALERLFRVVGGAVVELPRPDNLHEVPGPRWYRPWAPHVVVSGAGRSYLFGFDGRFRPDGFLDSRVAGQTLTALAVGPRPPVPCDGLLAGAAVLSVPQLPPEARALVTESLLFDPDSSGAMAAATVRTARPGSSSEEVQNVYRAGVQGMFLARDPKLASSERDALSRIVTFGVVPSPVAFSEWKDPTDPLFIVVRYSHPHSSLENDWELFPHHVDLTPRSAEATVPPPGRVREFSERTPATASMMKILQSAMFGKRTLDPTGQLVPEQQAPASLEADTWQKLDVISGPLTGLDRLLFGAGLRERCGTLRLNGVDVVDLFGIRRSWNSGTERQAPAGKADDPTILLPPRLPYWARLQFRFQQAAALAAEATAVAPPICGILLPDLLEHTVEVFDGDGKPIGQLESDRPRWGGTGTEPTTLNVRFNAHPWVADQSGNDLDAISNDVLKRFVASVVAQSTPVPAAVVDATGQEQWFETGLTAMMRVIDTLRGNLDRTVRTPDRRTRLLGEPILVLSARLSLEATATTDTAELSKEPSPLGPEPSLPAVPVHIGDDTRPDDGVLGCFLQAAPDDGQFAPVTKEAAEQAVLNALDVGTHVEQVVPVSHPFVKDQVSQFLITPNQPPRDLVILADPRGSLYATCGVVPRKKITIPTEFVESALKNLEPTFAVGPVLSFRGGGSVRPIVPPTDIEGLSAEFVYSEASSGDGPEEIKESKIPPVSRVSELPVDRVTIDRGWIRLFEPEI